MVILFVSAGDPKVYMLGSEDSDTVVLYTPGSGLPPSAPMMPGSVANHMPFADWQEFDGDEEAERQILAGMEGATA